MLGKTLANVWAVALGLGVTVVPAGTAVAQNSATTLVLPAKDAQLQAALAAALREPPFRRLVSLKRLSIALVDLSQPGVIRYAGVDDDRMRYAASLPKIGILLGAFDQIQKGQIRYTPALRAKMELMIRRSSNRESTDLIRLVGFHNIASTLRDPRYELYSSKRNGGLWVGRDYGGWIGTWGGDPLHQISHGATARQVARFFVMLDRGALVSQAASAEMKNILGDPAIHHKFVRGLEARQPTSRIFRKSGTWKNWHADAALVERAGKKYVAVALLESPAAKDVLSELIVKLDEIVHGPAGPTIRTAHAVGTTASAGDSLDTGGSR